MLKKLLISIALFLSFLLPVQSQSLCGDATFYSNWYEGGTMANGQTFHQSSNSAASNRYRLGTKLRVIYKNRVVRVVVRDRMGAGGFLDLSSSSFDQLESLNAGVIRVCTQVVGYEKW